MSQKILFISHTWTSADIVGANIVVNDNGVMRQFLIRETNPKVLRDVPEGFASAVSTLSCAGVAVGLTIDGHVIQAAMCLKIYNALIAIYMNPPDKRVRTTTYNRAASAAKNVVGKLKSCCGGS